MKKIFVIMAMLSIIAGPCFAAAQDKWDAESEWTGNVNMSGALRNLDADYWSPVESQPTFGIDFDFGKKGWLVHPLMAASVSSKDGTVSNTDGSSYTVTGATTEFDFGLKTNMGAGWIDPYLSAGLALMSAKVENKPSTSTGTKVSESDNFRPGVFVSGGLTFRVFDIFNVGGAVKLVKNTEVNLFGSKGNADYIQYSAVFGWGF